MASLTELNIYTGTGGGGYSQHNTCSDGERSAMSNGISTPSMCSEPGSGMDILKTLQSGMMPALSTGVPGLDLWMLSLRASRANLSAQPVRDLPKMILATDGLPSSASFAKYDPEKRSWRTFQVSYLSHTTDEYLGSWPKRVSISSRIAYRRRRSARTIKGNGSGLLPTPTAKQMLLYPTPVVSRGSWQRSPGSKKKRYSLRGMALNGLWPTPTSGDSKDRMRSKKSKAAGTGMTLLEKVLFATPNTRGIDNGKRGRIAAKRNGTFVTHSGGKLNPTWVEWLMGWPLGWTDLKPLEMDKFQQWLEKHGFDMEASEL